MEEFGPECPECGYEETLFEGGVFEDGAWNPMYYCQATEVVSSATDYERDEVYEERRSTCDAVFYERFDLTKATNLQTGKTYTFTNKDPSDVDDVFAAVRVFDGFEPHNYETPSEMKSLQYDSEHAMVEVKNPKTGHTFRLEYRG